MLVDPIQTSCFIKESNLQKSEFVIGSSSTTQMSVPYRTFLPQYGVLTVPYRTKELQFFY